LNANINEIETATYDPSNIHDFLETYDYEKPFSYNLPPHISVRGNKLCEKKRVDSLARTRNTIKRIVYANSNKLDKFLTLTFKNEKTLKEGNKCVGLFIKKLEYHTGNKYSYLAIPEFSKQNTKRLHYHIILFNSHFLNFKTLEKCWKFGYTNIKSLQGINYIGHYISKYLSKTNYEKRLIGQKCYFTSRNIKRPIEYKKFDKEKENYYNIKEDYQLINKNNYICITKQHLNNIMKNQITTKQALEIMKSKKIFSAEFVKKDGSIRKIVGRTGVTKHLKPNAKPQAYKPSERGYVTIYDFQKKDYRLINVQTLIKVNQTEILINQIK